MLSVNRLINVSVSLGATPVPGLGFNTLMIAGDSPVISGAERFRSYTTIGEVGNDFSSTDPEFLAAELYYSQNPKPVNLMIGRWLATATSGYNLGGIQSPTSQQISTWTGITDGGFRISIDGGAMENLSSLNFSGITNLNGVASVINTALTGAVCKWDGTEFVITSNSTGPGAAASGTITLTGNPAPNDTLTIGTTVITFVSSSPVGNQVVIGASSSATLTNLLAFLQNSLDSQIDQNTYSAIGLVITALYKVAGTAGNSFALATTSGSITLSAATLLGGAQPSSVGYATPGGGGSTDISGLLAMTSATSQALEPGFAAESPVQCEETLANLSTAWYGIMFATTMPVTVTQDLAICAFTEAAFPTRMFGVTSQDPNSLSSIVTNDLGSLMKAGGYAQSFCQYSSTTPYAVASIFGRMFTVDFTAENSTITLMYKQEPGVPPEDLSDTEANALQAKNINVYTEYDNNTEIIQYGTVANGEFIDTIWGLDWFQNALQTAVYNLLYTSTTKIPQTDAGQNQLTASCSAVCGNTPGGAVYNGLAGPGTWNSTTVFGSLTTGQYLPLGYYIFAPSIELQAESDRAARIAPTTQIALKLAGAFQTAEVLVTVNQ